MKNKRTCTAYILIFKSRQLCYDTHTVRAKHASVDALTPQESCIKSVRRVVSVREETICCLDTIKVTLVHAVSVDHADRGKRLPVEGRKNDAVTKQL